MATLIRHHKVIINPARGYNVSFTDVDGVSWDVSLSSLNHYCVYASRQVTTRIRVHQEGDTLRVLRRWSIAMNEGTFFCCMNNGNPHVDVSPTADIVFDIEVKLPDCEFVCQTDTVSN